MKKESVGLIGCGRMGICMAQKLLEHDYPVVVYDQDPAAIQAALSLGACTVSTPPEVFRKALVVLLSLPGPAQIEAVLFQSGALEVITEGHTLVDTSTVSPDTTRNAASRIQKACGAAYLDCPVLGRPAAAGKWLLPTGGPEEALRKVYDILRCFAADALSVGDNGAGNALKLLNQLMFGAINAVTAEVMAIAGHVGIDPEVFYQTVASSSAATVSGLFRETGRTILEEKFDQPAFTVDLLIKDMNLALDMAREADAPSVLGEAVQVYNRIAHSQSLGNEDTAALYKVFCRHYEKRYQNEA